MKLPRGVSGDQLIRSLERLGYKRIRQKGSHVRLRTDGPPIHFITVPLHDSLKIGTLHGILTEVAHMRSIPIEAILQMLE
jgi:predicted RNA binding protein YcfA (HicA-like mRNA interferase family)